MNQATSWAEFAEACTYNRMPSENMVWVDKTGTIGWQAAGIAPLRSWSGMLPVPGDGRYEWDGYLPINALPSEVNPDRGFIATANHYLFPNDYPYPNARHYTWADPVSRAPHRGSHRLGPSLQRGRDDAPAERRPVDGRPRHGAAPARSAVHDSRRGGRPRPRARLGLRARQELERRRRLRAVLAPAHRGRPPGLDSRGRAGVGAGRAHQHQARHRLPLRARWPLRQRTHQGARPDGGHRLRAGRRRRHRAFRRPAVAPGSGATRSCTTPSSGIRSRTR